MFYVYKCVYIIIYNVILINNIIISGKTAEWSFVLN